MSDQTPNIPTINKPLMGGFHVFIRRYLRKNFHTIAVRSEALTPCGIEPGDTLVVYANHASWWDPLMAMYLADHFFPGFRMFAPIDAEAFEKYRMFGKMGFYPLKQDSLEGARSFLKVSRAILSDPGASIWITPEGRFADVRDKSAELMPGLSHLALSMLKRPSDAVGRTWFIALAVEYAFWEERSPEALAWFAEPILVEEQDARQRMGDQAFSKAAWHQRLTDSLRENQQRLAEVSIARDTKGFEVLASNAGGTFFLYDWGRKLKSKLTGKKLDIQHGDKFAN